MGTPNAVKVGPGLLYCAPIGTAEPTTGSGALPSAWLALGYTEEGSTFTPETTYEPIEVAEELDELRNVATKRSTMIEFSLAEMTATNVLAAYNGGTVSAAAGGFVEVEPPDLGEELRLMLLWDSDDDQERLLMRKALQVGPVGQARKKAPDKTLLPVQFKLEIPDDGSKPFKHWLPSALSYVSPHT